MSKFDETFDIQDYVYEGLWKNHHEPPFRKWTWTLRSQRALLGLAALSLLIAFTQARAWVLVRYLVYQRKKSPRLDDPDHTDDLLKLSQGTAIEKALQYIKAATADWFRQSQRSRLSHESQMDRANADDFIRTSPLFGAFALVNIVVFIVSGIAVPYALSGGSLEPPIVKSKITNACLEAAKWEKFVVFISHLQKVDSILQQCQNRLNDTCNNQFYLQKPQVSTRRVQTCPFLGDVCMNDTMAVEMLHTNISAYEIGVNSATGITMNHRLTCAPIHLTDFLMYGYKRVAPGTLPGSKEAPVRYIDGNPVAITDAFITIMASKSLKELKTSVAMQLHTLNGPNSLTTENSGRRMAEEGIAPDITIFPRLFSSVTKTGLRPALQLENALPFLVIYRAGTTKYLSPVEDPFFAAHYAGTNSNDIFYADHEATALGCSEQYQFCRTDPSHCTTWAEDSRAAYEFLDNPDPSIEPRDEVEADIITLFRMFPSLFSVYEYASWRVVGLPGTLLPLITPTNRFGEYENTDRWVVEVETWFTKAILEALFITQYGARWPLDQDSQNYSMAFKRKSGLCGRILFRNSGYTNINWIGMWCTVATLVFICVASYMIESIHSSFKILLWKLRKVFSLVQMIWRMTRRVVNDLRVMFWTFLLWLSRGDTFQYFFVRRYPRQRAGVPSGPAVNIEMTFADAGLDEDGVNLEYEDIDGLI
jgi:hypothetical protein